MFGSIAHFPHPRRLRRGTRKQLNTGLCEPPLFCLPAIDGVVPCVMARKAGTGFGDIVGSGVNKRLGSTG